MVALLAPLKEKKMEKEITHKVTMPTIGRKYHIKWAKSFSMVWKLKAIDGNICHLVTKRGKAVTCRIDQLLETNRNVNNQ